MLQPGHDRNSTQELRELGLGEHELECSQLGDDLAPHDVPHHGQ